MLGRVLREGTRVPLFLGQTFINSLRDVGYNTTTPRFVNMSTMQSKRCIGDQSSTSSEWPEGFLQH